MVQGIDTKEESSKLELKPTRLTNKNVLVASEDTTSGNHLARVQDNYEKLEIQSQNNFYLKKFPLKPFSHQVWMAALATSGLLRLGIGLFKWWPSEIELVLLCHWTDQDLIGLGTVK